MTTNNSPLVGLVGPCASGKSTLVAKLAANGVRVRHIAQEHSYVKDMWKRITNPDILIFLDVSWEVANQRKNLNWQEKDWAEQERRLSHAREHADLYIHTDALDEDGVFEQVMAFLSDLQG